MRTRLFIYYTLATAIICTWFLLFHLPTDRKIQLIKLQIIEKQNRLTDFNKTLAELSNYVQTSSNLESHKVELSSRLYSKNEILKLFRQLESDAVRNNLKITEIIPPLEELLELNKTFPNSEEPLFLNITLKLEGNYINFGKYINQLERASFFRGINFCRLNSPQKNPTGLNLAVAFKALLGHIGESK